MRGLVAALCLAGPAWADCVALEHMGYVLPVAGEVTVTEEPGRPGLLLDFAPGGRAPKVIWLFALKADEPSADPSLDAQVLPNGLIAHYRSRVAGAAGSGGSEVKLSGWLEGPVPLGLSCWTQQEYTNPEWCLPILGELRPAADGCEAKED